MYRPKSHIFPIISGKGLRLSALSAGFPLATSSYSLQFAWHRRSLLFQNWIDWETPWKPFLWGYYPCQSTLLLLPLRAWESGWAVSNRIESSFWLINSGGWIGRFHEELRNHLLLPCKGWFKTLNVFVHDAPSFKYLKFPTFSPQKPDAIPLSDLKRYPLYLSTTLSFMANRSSLFPQLTLHLDALRSVVRSYCEWFGQNQTSPLLLLSSQLLHNPLHLSFLLSYQAI